MSEQAVDEVALGAWLGGNVEGFLGPFELTKFPSGQSNPTYKISAASGQYVLRRKPFGQLLPSAHARDTYTRRLEGVSLWVVPSATIVASDPDEAGELFEPAESKIYRHPTFYDIPDEVKHI